MRPVYTWPIIYILLFLLPSQLRAQPSHSASFLLRTCIGSLALKHTASNHAEINTPEAFREGELVSINGRYALIARQNQTGGFNVITSLNPPTSMHFLQEDILRFEPPLILKQLALMERLSNN